MTDKPLNVLLVEDNAGDALLLREILQEVLGKDFVLRHIERLADALDVLRTQDFDVLLLDLSLPDSHGLDTVSRMNSQAPNLPIVVLTGANDEMLGTEAVRRGAQDYLVKGEVSGLLLGRSIRYATERKCGEAELRMARDMLERRVRERTFDLEEALNALQEEVQFRAQTEEALRESEERFRQMAEATPEVFWIASPDLERTFYVNSAFEKIWGRPREEVYANSKLWTDCVVAEDRDRVERLTRQWLEQVGRGASDSWSVEYRVLRPDGSVSFVHSRRFAILDDRGKLQRVSGIAEDITEQRQREQAQQRLAAIVESTSDGILSTSPEGVIQTWNAGAEKLLGYTPSQVIGRSLLTLVHAERRKEIIDLYGQVRHNQTVGAFETVAGRSDGQNIQVQVTLSPVVETTGQLTAVSAIIRDITERNMLQQKVIEVGEAERRRIGHDLHDTLGQMLTGLAVMMKVLTQKLSKQGIPEADDAANITKLLNQAIAQARGLARGLRQAELHPDGFMTAIQEFVQDAKNIYGVNCTFEARACLLVHDSAVATQLYHVVREAVTNAMKHSRAKNVWVIVSATEGRTSLTVRDDGVGLSETSRQAKGMGMQIMQYRSRMIGATLSIDSSPQGGTTVTCILPVSQPML